MLSIEANKPARTPNLKTLAPILNKITEFKLIRLKVYYNVLYVKLNLMQIYVHIQWILDLTNKIANMEKALKKSKNDTLRSSQMAIHYFFKKTKSVRSVILCLF
jgi:hypothetical protein